MRDRRTFLKAAGATLASLGVAGCNADSTDSDQSTTDPATTEPATTAENAGGEVDANAAVAAQWNVYRARLADAAVLGLVDEHALGERTVAGVFADFESASGEYGAHEKLEGTSTEHYEGFEEAVVGLQETLAAGDADAARTHQQTADDHLAAAQRELVGERAANALDALAFGDRAATASALAAAGRPEDAGVAANAALTDFEDAAAHDALESAAADAYETFEGSLGDVLTEGQRGNAESAGNAADDAFAAAVEGAYAIGSEQVAGAGYLASVQSQAYDAATVAGLGGPAASFSHAATLTAYRARAYDAARLAARGETDAAATAAIDILEHFEGADAHEPLEEGDHEAYEGFEGGVRDLQTAIQDGSGVADALAQVDENLVAGVDALATSTEAAVLEAGFFRARLGDARERYRRGDAAAAATLVEDLFARFESNELGVHETLESTSESLYETFEHEHLEPLPDAMREGTDAVAEHLDGALGALLDFETQASSRARVSGAESAFVAARAFDAATLATAGDRERAASVASGAMAHFEAGAGGFHEALEGASEDTYHAFEEALVGVEDAATGDADVYAAAQSFFEQSLAATDAVVTAAGGELGAVAAGVVRDAYEGFETARVHDLLADADESAYQSFESALEEYASALESGGGSVDAVATAALRAQFAVVGAVEQAPVGEGSEGGEPELSGGPNVVSGVPDDADHVVNMNAVAYDPAELTVEVGDKVAWKHAEGEPHSVTAAEDDLPEGASYWASGGFDSEDAAATGWENGEGAVTSGKAYVHTFETAGEHAYYCIPHETLGMTGTVVVEEP